MDFFVRTEPPPHVFTDTPGNVDVIKLVWKYKCSMDREKHRNQQMSRDISFLQTDKMDLQETVEKQNNSLNNLESELMQLQKENRNLKLVDFIHTHLSLIYFEL